MNHDEIDERGTTIARHAYGLIMNLPQSDEILMKASLGYFYAALLCAKMQIERILGPDAVKQLKAAVFLVDEQDFTSPSEDFESLLTRRKGQC